MAQPQDIWTAMETKLIAILRGIKPAETEGIVSTLLDLGFRAIEIPLNSPDPFTSIETAARLGGQLDDCLIGAGTVLSRADVARVKNAGGSIIVSPNIDADVVEASHVLGMASFPGVFTATEAHKAVQLGVAGLKFFPASLLGPEGISAIRATLPPEVSIAAVGGVGVGNFKAYRDKGIHAFGLGSNLYKPGDTAAAVKEKSQAVLAAYTAAG